MSSFEVSPVYALALRPDNLAIITYSSNLDAETMDLNLSALSKFVADVALAGWANRHTEYIVASERSFENHQTTGELIDSFFTAEGIDESRINLINKLPSTGEELNNTSQQIQALAEEFKGKPGTLLALAMGYHIPRIAKHARYFGLELNLVAADKLWPMPVIQDGIARYGLDRERHLQVLDALPVFAKRESTIRRSTFFDRSGFITRTVNKFQGPCLHDVDLITGEAIISTTPKRYRELTEVRDAA
jgi:hypothetical protein